MVSEAFLSGRRQLFEGWVDGSPGQEKSRRQVRIGRARHLPYKMCGVPPRDRMGEPEARDFAMGRANCQLGGGMGNICWDRPSGVSEILWCGVN
jgi:hypothetical protein